MAGGRARRSGVRGLFASDSAADPDSRQTPSIAVVDRSLVEDLVTGATAQYAVQAPARLEGYDVVLVQLGPPSEDADPWLLAAPRGDRRPWPA